MPSADSCGDPFLEKQIDSLLPAGCGAEAVFNFSWEKVFGSGDDDDKSPTTIGTVVIPTRSLLSTPTVGVGIISVTPNKSAPRLPPRFTPSPESRHSSFQQLLRIHLNTFNQRLSMLEKNTLDMKESIHGVQDQQGHLSAQLKELIALQSVVEKSKKVAELEKSYTDMEGRLSRLEGRLEILIDGFTALAQEMNKLKRSRYTSRSLQEKRALPSLATVLEIPTHSSTQLLNPTETPYISKATVPKSIPTPKLPVSKVTTASQRNRKPKSSPTTTPIKTSTQVTRSSKNKPSTRSATKTKTTLSKPKTASKSTSKATTKPETKRQSGRRSTLEVKQVSQPSKPKPKQEKKGAITKFQVEPPSHKKPDQANKKDSSSPLKNNRHNKAFRSDAPDPKKVPEVGKSSESNSKKSVQPQQNGNQNSHKLLSHKEKNPRKVTVSTTRPTKTTTAKKRTLTTVKKKSTPNKPKATTVKKKASTTVKRKPPSPKTTARKVTKKLLQKKKNPQSGVLDLLRLLKGDRDSSNQKKSQDGSLHVVLGRLAIPIKIIPDN